tara:strand:- start:10278 stop:10556 length:279 start_codon:yes stop_codon:yes gene_type:complete
MKNTTSQTKNENKPQGWQDNIRQAQEFRKVPRLIKLELTHEDLTDIRELLNEKLSDAETAVARSRHMENEDDFEKAQQDICKFEDLLTVLRG